jgi:hypothetical protein
MKKRNPGIVILLSFVTFGIYCIYWLYATRKELVRRNHNSRSIPPVILLFAPLFLITALIVALFAIGAALDSSQAAVSVLLFVLTIIGALAIIALPLWWYWRYCQVVAESVKPIGGMDFAQMYVLHVVLAWMFWLLPVWMLIVQVELNKLIDHDAQAHHLHPPHPDPNTEHHPYSHHTPAAQA